MLRKQSWLIILSVQLLILVMYAGTCCMNTYHSESVNNKMLSGYVEQTEGGFWYVDEDCGVSDGKIFLYGPYHTIKKGSYTISIDYEADWNHSIDIFSKHHSDKLFSDKQIILKRGKGTERAKIRVTDDIDDLEIRFYYAGRGYIKVNNVSIAGNNEEEKGNLFCLAVFMIIVDLCLFFSWQKKVYFLRQRPVMD